MNYWLAQLILAARKSNEDKGWIQILVFIVFVAFSVLSSIVGKLKSKKNVSKGKVQPPGKPVHKPPELTADLRMLKQLFGLPDEEAEPSSQPTPEASGPQIAKQQVLPTVRKVVRPQPMPERKTPIMVRPQVSIPQVQPKLGKVPGLTDEAELPTEIPQLTYLTDILSDYGNAEKLRRAILHSEILGKPISLREQERAF